MEVNMRLKIIKTLALFIVLSGMVGIASADPCPNPETWDNRPTSNLYLVVAEGNNPFTYKVGGGLDTHNAIREVCVASRTQNAISGTADFD